MQAAAKAHLEQELVGLLPSAAVCSISVAPLAAGLLSTEPSHNPLRLVVTRYTRGGQPLIVELAVAPLPPAATCVAGSEVQRPSLRHLQAALTAV